MNSRLWSLWREMQILVRIPVPETRFPHLSIFLKGGDQPVIRGWIAGKGYDHDVRGWI
ncbi:MAG: hypothetical protein R2875_12295 [Desulfobacterales bacterium]